MYRFILSSLLSALFFGQSAPASDDLVQTMSVTISAIDGGACRRFAWEVHVIVCRRSSEQISQLAGVQPALLGAPDDSELMHALQSFQLGFGRAMANNLLAMSLQLMRNPMRSLRDDVFVAVLSNPYDYCSIRYEARGQYTEDVDSPHLLDGFVNACKGETYDLAGRVLVGHQHATEWNLFIPPHRYLDEDTLLLGELPLAAARTNFDFGPNLHDQRLSPDHQLLLAAEWGDEKLVRKLLESRVDVNTVNWSNESPLLLASSWGNTNVVDLLLKMGADPDVVNSTGYSALHFSLMRGHHEVTRLLLAAGASTEIPCKAHDCAPTPLILLLRITPYSQTIGERVQLLLDHGASPDASFGGKTAIQYAEDEGNSEVIDLLKR
ncbi:MAG: ankyrin repeat domain-containing protein [Woeseiaceae bacterium]